MAKLGAFTFVLHCHLPYCRQAGYWPHGENWLHAAAAETYIPLLNALSDLYDQGLPARLTLNLSPILCEQLADRDVQANFAAYLDDKIARAAADVARLQRDGAFHRARLAEWYFDWYATIAESFVTRFNRDIVGGFRRLQDLGVVEIVTSPATHAYLPLLATDENISAQWRMAVACHRRHFKRAPRAAWLPECAYRPGLESFLAREGLGLFFADAHAIIAGTPVGRAAGNALDDRGRLIRNYVLPAPEGSTLMPASTSLPYYVGTPGRQAHDGVITIGRNERVVAQVWNGDWGYPSDPDYRDFHKQDGDSGLGYWRITDMASDLDCKEEWHPATAMQRAGEHARHFASLVSSLVQANAAESQRYGILCASFDAELFGHWWFEGIDWLREVLHLLADTEAVELVTASEYAEQHPPTDVLALSEGSWGRGGANIAWDNAETQVLWQQVHAAEQRMVAIARQFQHTASVEAEPLLAQLARETLLLQASDWPFLVSTGQARDYAYERFNVHLSRFNQLADAIQRGVFDVEPAAECYEQDKVFADIDWRWWV